MKEVVKQLLGNHIYPEEGLNFLKDNNSLTPFQKNCVWTYCYPLNIGDYELPGLIQNERGLHQEGWLKPKDEEILLLLRAYSCKQYEGYMKHLMWAFTKNPSSIIIPSHREEDEELTCGICSKILYPWDEWEDKCKSSPAYKESERREFLAFASNMSSQCMCLNCQIQMNALLELLKEMGIE